MTPQELMEYQVTFSGRRFYEVRGPLASISLVPGEAYMAFSAVDRYGSYPASDSIDSIYAQWLSESGCNDPFYDEELQKEYEMHCFSELVDSVLLRVRPRRVSREDKELVLEVIDGNLVSHS